MTCCVYRDKISLATVPEWQMLQLLDSPLAPHHPTLTGEKKKKKSHQIPIIAMHSGWLSGTIRAS